MSVCDETSCSHLGPMPDGNGDFIPDTVVFNGIAFYRYPTAKCQSNRDYFMPSKADMRRGIGRLHVEIWKAAHGREVPKGGYIHHVDGNPLNNSVDNLVCLSGREHRRIHEALAPKEYRVCEHCGATFPTTIYRPGRFCSTRCRGLALYYSGRNDESRVCVVCGKEFVTNRYKTTTTCSKQCTSRIRARTPGGKFA
jgi:predicted nucleic acid-binding Zn ribbon protein